MPEDKYLLVTALKQVVVWAVVLTALKQVVVWAVVLMEVVLLDRPLRLSANIHYGTHIGRLRLPAAG